MKKRFDRDNFVEFISAYMGGADYRWYRTNQEAVRIHVRYQNPSDYQLSISTVPEEIPATGAVQCWKETVPQIIVDWLQSLFPDIELFTVQYPAA